MIRFQRINGFSLLTILLFITFYVSASGNLFGQKQTKLKNISWPEKWWAVFHPFSAKKAYQLTDHVLQVTDSLKHASVLDTLSSGGRIDAFKHSYWMAVLSNNIGWRKSRKLGKAHEKGNYRAFKRAKRKNSTISQDKASSDMDLWNNEQGIRIARKYPEATNEQLADLILSAIFAGEMRIVRRDEKGHFLDADGQIIPQEELIGKWENRKVLVSSDN